MSNRFKAAVIQAAPVLFDREATVAKACRLIAEAGAEDVRVALLPEAFITACPKGLSFGAVVGQRSEPGRDSWKKYWHNAVDVPGPVTEALGEAAQAADLYPGVGVIERDGDFSGGTLYCTLLYFGPDGTLLGKHRKLKPTASERLIRGEGDGSTMPVFDTEYGRIGGLICWENYMPLARILGKHRKLKPTASERLIRGEGDGSTMPVFDTEYGRIGGLICWENYMPLARILGKHRKLKPTTSERLIRGEGDGSTMPVFDTEYGRIGGLNLLGELPCRPPAWPPTAKACRSTWRRRPTAAIHGRRPGVTSAARAAASCLDAISFLPATTIPGNSKALRNSKGSRRFSPAAAAPSSRPSAKNLPDRSITRRAC